jgi:hypothetical protein
MRSGESGQVASGMPVGVAEGLEVVKVKDGHGDQTLLTGGSEQLGIPHAGAVRADRVRPGYDEHSEDGAVLDQRL